MTQRKYQCPKFLEKTKPQDDYEKWLQRKAQSLARRDRRWLESQGKDPKTVVTKAYKVAIHKAVCKCQGKDAYTGELLSWDLLGKWDNEKAKTGKKNFKKEFALLPTVDHISALGVADFEICAWRTNDAKNDLTLKEFKELCKKVLEYQP